jgi:hypothetical protein
MPPGPPPLVQLEAMLADLRAADRLPWPDVSVALVEEQRMFALARRAGEEGMAMAARIEDQIERLFFEAEQEALNAAARL